MLDVLVDTSVIADLVVSLQQKRRRNRYVASSAVAAIECFLFYDNLLVDHNPSFSDPSTENRFSTFNLDDHGLATNQLNDLVQFFGVTSIDQDLRSECYDASLAFLETNLSPIDDPEDLRAYELYDFLPYNLGDDPTAIECQINAASASELAEVVDKSPEHLKPVLLRLDEILQSKSHPQRAAWALPLLRFLYLQALQQKKRTHFVPHATKSTLGFGREFQTVRSRRLVDYCTPSFREAFVEKSMKSLGDGTGSFLVPDIGRMLLSRFNGWDHFVNLVVQSRESNQMKTLRTMIANSLNSDQGSLPTHVSELDAYGRQLQEELNPGGEHRVITISLPHLADEIATTSCPFLLIHQLHQTSQQHRSG